MIGMQEREQHGRRLELPDVEPDMSMYRSWISRAIKWYWMSEC